MSTHWNMKSLDVCTDQQDLVRISQLYDLGAMTLTVDSLCKKLRSHTLHRVGPAHPMLVLAITLKLYFLKVVQADHNKLWHPKTSLLTLKYCCL